MSCDRVRFFVLVFLSCCFFSASLFADGKKTYTMNCLPCHQANGAGVPGVYPPLTMAGDYLRIPEGRAYLVQVLTTGMMGAIKSQGKMYNGFMTPVGHLPDAELADLINYLATKIGKAPAKFKLLTPSEVKQNRAKDLSPPGMIQKREIFLEKLKQAGVPVSMNEQSSEVIAPAIEADLVSKPVYFGAALDYEMQCRGCHRVDGARISTVVPGLTSVGLFAHIPEGRAFLSRVPGVAGAPLGDDRLANLLNWTLYKYSGGFLPVGFQAYTPDEVRGYRELRIYDVPRVRDGVIAKLRLAGLDVPGPL